VLFPPIQPFTVPLFHSLVSHTRIPDIRCTSTEHSSNDVHISLACTHSVVRCFRVVSELTLTVTFDTKLKCNAEGPRAVFMHCHISVVMPDLPSSCESFGRPQWAFERWLLDLPPSQNTCHDHLPRLRFVCISDVSLPSWFHMKGKKGESVSVSERGLFVSLIFLTRAWSLTSHQGANQRLTQMLDCPNVSARPYTRGAVQARLRRL
jgi:hypothetical protein